jgi:hypothetical protein
MYCQSKLWRKSYHHICQSWKEKTESSQVSYTWIHVMHLPWRFIVLISIQLWIVHRVLKGIWYKFLIKYTSSNTCISINLLTTMRCLRGVCHIVYICRALSAHVDGKARIERKYIRFEAIFIWSPCNRIFFLQ